VSHRKVCPLIRKDDVRFHTPTPTPYDWAETNFFSVLVPEENIYAWAYTVARPGVGALMCDIQVIDVIDSNPLSARYVDIQQHLPIPDRLEDYELPNGLALATSNEPYDYHLRYEGVDDTSFDWHVSGLMEPYDITDPAMDPLASPDPEKTGFGTAYASHFDMSVSVTGNLRVRGRDFEVDCASVMDHSWGQRNERLMRPMAWINANFGKEFSVNTIWVRHIDKSGFDGYTFAHGYVQIEDKVHGLNSGRITAGRNKHHFPTGYEMHVEDKFGEKYAFTGYVTAQLPWSPYSNIVDANSAVRWHMPDGRVGVGVSQELVPLDGRTGWSK